MSQGLRAATAFRGVLPLSETPLLLLVSTWFLQWSLCITCPGSCTSPGFSSWSWSILAVNLAPGWEEGTSVSSYAADILETLRTLFLTFWKLPIDIFKKKFIFYYFCGICTLMLLPFVKGFCLSYMVISYTRRKLLHWEEVGHLSALTGKLRKKQTQMAAENTAETLLPGQSPWRATLGTRACASWTVTAAASTSSMLRCFHCHSI